MSTPMLDWRDLAPDPEMHCCGCELCPSDGDFAPVRMPTLVVCDVDGAEYVTDRFLLLPASLAPVPPGYEQLHPQRPDATTLIAQLSSITPEQPRGSHFPRSTLRALDLTGWDLRRLSGQATPTRGVPRVAVVDQEGAPIGVAITASNPDRDDVDIYAPREMPA